MVINQRVTPELHDKLKVYADYTQMLLPTVGDTIKIETPDGQQWLVKHVRSVQDERLREARMWWEIRQMLAFLAFVMGVFLLVLTWGSHPKEFLGPHNQHVRIVRSVAWAVYFFAGAAWAAWCKPAPKAPDGSAQ